MSRLSQHDPPQASGKVFLVGAGPGDPGMLTLRGRDCLAAADVVLYDYLASEALLRHASPSAERVCLGRHGEGKLWTQEQINQRIVAEARAGRTVVRLKGGDPGIFGRVAEEIAACRSASLRYEIVPGVTTAMAAGAFAGVTLTDRERSSCVALVTGHERQGKPETEQLDFAALAQFPGTLVVYMGVTNAQRWSSQLLAGGKAPETPVLLVRRCSLADQTTLDCTLAEVPDALESHRMRPPLVAVVGQVARGREAADWFTSRPLFGKSVLVTRPQEQCTAITRQLEGLGARVLCQPAITIGPPESWERVDRAIEELDSFDRVLFSSRNGVCWFLERMRHLGADARRFGSARIAAIGPATAEALREWHLKADYVPTEYRAEALVQGLAETSVRGERLLLVRASRGREVLAQGLTAAGANVVPVVAYRSTDTQELDPFVATELTAGRIDWITATSSAIARSLVRMVEPHGWGTARLAAISPLTAGVLEELGHPPSAVADCYTSEGLVEALLRVEGIEPAEPVAE